MILCLPIHFYPVDLFVEQGISVMFQKPNQIFISRSVRGIEILLIAAITAMARIVAAFSIDRVCIVWVCVLLKIIFPSRI